MADKEGSTAKERGNKISDDAKIGSKDDSINKQATDVKGQVGPDAGKAADVKSGLDAGKLADTKVGPDAGKTADVKSDLDAGKLDDTKVGPETGKAADVKSDLDAGKLADTKVGPDAGKTAADTSTTKVGSANDLTNKSSDLDSQQHKDVGGVKGQAEHAHVTFKDLIGKCAENKIEKYIDENKDKVVEGNTPKEIAHDLSKAYEIKIELGILKADVLSDPKNAQSKEGLDSVFTKLNNLVDNCFDKHAHKFLKLDDKKDFEDFLNKSGFKHMFNQKEGGELLEDFFFTMKTLQTKYNIPEAFNCEAGGYCTADNQIFG